MQPCMCDTFSLWHMRLDSLVCVKVEPWAAQLPRCVIPMSPPARLPAQTCTRYGTYAYCPLDTTVPCGRSIGVDESSLWFAVAGMMRPARHGG